MTKRVLRVPIEMFKEIILKGKLMLEKIDEGMQKELEEITYGCFVMVTTLNDKEEALVMHKHQTHINQMIGQEHLHSLKVRFELI